MTNYLFEGFLSNADDYASAETYWRELWLDLRHDGWVQPWMDNGAFLDGNPIFTAFNPLQRKGIRIVQRAPQEGANDLVYWLDTFGGDVTEPESIRELVIDCVLSRRTAEAARHLMRQWIDGEVSVSHDLELTFSNGWVERDDFEVSPAA